MTPFDRARKPTRRLPRIACFWLTLTLTRMATLKLCVVSCGCCLMASCTKSYSKTTTRKTSSDSDSNVNTLVRGTFGVWSRWRLVGSLDLLLAAAVAAALFRCFRGLSGFSIASFSAAATAGWHCDVAIVHIKGSGARLAAWRRAPLAILIDCRPSTFTGKILICSLNPLPLAYRWRSANYSIMLANSGNLTKRCRVVV